MREGAGPRCLSAFRSWVKGSRATLTFTLISLHTLLLTFCSTVTSPKSGFRFSQRTPFAFKFDTSPDQQNTCQLITTNSCGTDLSKMKIIKLPCTGGDWPLGLEEVQFPTISRQSIHEGSKVILISVTG